MNVDNEITQKIFIISKQMGLKSGVEISYWGDRGSGVSHERASLVNFFSMLLCFISKLVSKKQLFIVHQYKYAISVCIMIFCIY